MTNLTFEGDMARIQQGLAQCHNMVIRRSTLLETLNLRTGERVLEVGCGAGFYAYEAAMSVGSTGSVFAIDISADQVAAATERCAELSWVECKVADLLSIPFEDSEFDVVYGVQVLEYVPNLQEAIQEIHRVLRPGGRLVNLATNWNSLVWHSAQPKRMEHVLSAFKEHAPHPDLPSILQSHLRKVAIRPLRQTPVPVLNTSYNENSFSYWLARMIRSFVIGRNSVTDDEADAWLEEFEELEGKGHTSFVPHP